MGNVLPPNKDIHETYDLKGSTLGRLLPEEEILKNPYAVMKDLNWEKRGNKLQLGPQKRKLFITQLLRDVKVKKGYINFQFFEMFLLNHSKLIIAFGKNEYYGL
jgi:hypothetical protein